MKKIFLLFIVTIFLILCNVQNCWAINEIENISNKNLEVINNYYRGKVHDISKKINPDTLEEGKVSVVEIIITSGNKKNDTIKIFWVPISESEEIFQLKAGDKIIVKETIFDSNHSWSIVDKDRTNLFIALFFILALMLILISKKQGLKALTSLIIIALVIIFFMVPGILKGYNPLLITFSTIAFFIIPTLLFSHGLHKKTYVAIAGIIFSVIMIGFMAQIVINIAQLTGINEAETMYINLFGNKIDLIHLLLSAIILGAVGVMDDITITQSSIVYEISKTNKFNAKKLFTKAMRVGNDHISATINTLFLAYTSVSLPLIILISKQQENIFYLINREIIATEIIRIFIGTIGILLTIPITTFLASMVFSRNK